MVWRAARPYPVIIQVVFAVSFVLFLFFFDRLKNRPLALWIWTGVEASLGVTLIRGRLKARERILRCIRCSADLG